MLEQFYDFSARLLELDQKAMGLCRPEFEKIDAIRDYNQVKMLKAFTENRVAATHLAGTTGYGYDDAGRDKLDRVFAQAVGAEDALCRPHFLSGTQDVYKRQVHRACGGGQHPAGRARRPGALCGGAGPVPFGLRRFSGRGAGPGRQLAGRYPRRKRYGAGHGRGLCPQPQPCLPGV